MEKACPPPRGRLILPLHIVRRIGYSCETAFGGYELDPAASLVESIADSEQRPVS